MRFAALSIATRTALACALAGRAVAAQQDGKQPEPEQTVEGVGLSPSLPELGDEVDVPPHQVPSALPRDGGYQFQFHGYLRAPLRVGLGPSNDGAPRRELHSPPRVPDLSSTDWRYIDNVPGPWTQLVFSYGNERATMTASIAGFNHTNAGYRDLQAQLGINQAFVTLRFPNAFGRYGGLDWNIGSFSNRYGTAGKYNAGMYETYLFGRTRVAGETLTAALHLSQSLTLTLEHGVGAKLDVIPFEAPVPRPEYLPYPGPVAQGSTFVHHAHAELGINKSLEMGLHYLTSFTPNDRGIAGAPASSGRMTISGGEVRFDGDVFGDGYIGFSHIDARNILPLADAIEVLHSFGGWQFKNNYFGRFDPRTGIRPPDESGIVNSLLFQYSLSLGKIARYPTRFWGNGPDLVLTLFGMFNAVDSANNAHNKLKYGAEAVYTLIDELGVGLRYDLVQPDLRDRDESFAVLSPKLILRTAFLTHERVILQYSRYFLGSEAYAAFPFEELDRADRDVFMIAATMWW
jgi:hypothetical protein